MEDAAAAAWRGWKVATLLKPRPLPSQAHELLTAEEVKPYINLSARVVHIIREGDPHLLHPARGSFTLRYLSLIEATNVRLRNRLVGFPHLLQKEQNRMLNQYGSVGANNRPLISLFSPESDARLYVEKVTKDMLGAADNLDSMFPIVYVGNRDWSFLDAWEQAHVLITAREYRRAIEKAYQRILLDRSARNAVVVAQSLQHSNFEPQAQRSARPVELWRRRWA